MDLVSNLTEGGDGKITYLSASPFEIHHILCKLESAQRHPVFGELIFPDGMAGELVPCIVACHGSRGWADHHQDHINNWLGAGFAVFCINSFDSREVDSTVESQMMVTYAMMLSDAFEALKLLNTHPLIDSGKIAITGWSLGGTVALYSAWKPIAESLAQNGERFVAHMPFYPAAHLRPEDNRWQDVPIKIFHGEMDDYTPLSLVQGLIDEVNKIGVSMELEIYPNSHHSFDSKEEMQWLPNAIKLDERTVQISLEGEMWGEIEEGIKVPLNEPHERLAAFNL
ncbi:MAG TPA: dienelactone hydrolase family protein, partial [Candidatus Thalassarchaeaceae archaeon]|nr:dienelactone hydrolase family protein [Candidatus Thalassarchaeaceae archaeon]